MSPVRPDLVECWVFRVLEPLIEPADTPDPGALEFLLIHRAPGRIFAGLWQCVTGGLEADERVPLAALREVREETAIGPTDVVAFYDLDMVASFYDEGPDAIVSSAIFALRVGPHVEPRLSPEHDAFRWVTADEARSLAVWPSYGECLDRVQRCLMRPAAAGWFELDLEGHRLRR